MIPKQTPVRNFRPAACRFTLSFPRGLSREGKLCASSPSSRNIRFPNCAARLYALYRNRRRQSRPVPPAVLHCRVIFRPAFPARPVTGKELPYLPAFLSQPTVAEKPYTAKMPCTAIVCGCTVPFPCRLPSRAFRQNPHKKKRSPVRGFSHVCVWRDSNPRPSESESDALSNCATNTKYPTTIPCFAPESKAIFYSRLFRLCSAGFS